MHVLQAVLDTQFWLSTHVVTVTLGYGATLLAGLLGTCALVHRMWVRRLKSTQQDSKTAARVQDRLYRMTYGVVCFALFFSFIGTVLGGLWADDSWGRFWGWDPKENGALMIVLWNALSCMPVGIVGLVNVALHSLQLAAISSPRGAGLVPINLASVTQLWLHKWSTDAARATYSANSTDCTRFFSLEKNLCGCRVGNICLLVCLSGFSWLRWA